MTNSPIPAAEPAPREIRRRELARRTKAQLAREVRRTLIYSAYPPESWRKDELITSILDREFLPALADGQAPEPGGPLDEA
jgi:hypothetical protein